MIVVIICNAVKITCFVFAIAKQDFTPLVTLGDGLASFLERTDEYTMAEGPIAASDVRRSEECSMQIQDAIRRLQVLMTSQNFERHSRNNEDYIKLNRSIGILKNMDQLFPILTDKWKNRKLRWYSGASKLRWALTYTM